MHETMFLQVIYLITIMFLFIVEGKTTFQNFFTEESGSDGGRRWEAVVTPAFFCRVVTIFPPFLLFLLSEREKQSGELKPIKRETED